MENNDYLLTIQVPYEGMDDIAAKIYYRKIMENVDLPENANVKVQQLFTDKAPRKIGFDVKED